MALWGKDDNLTSAGNVTLAYDGSAKNNAGAWVLTTGGLCTTLITLTPQVMSSFQ